MVRQRPAEVKGPAGATRELSRRQVLGDELYRA